MDSCRFEPDRGLYPLKNINRFPTNTFNYTKHQKLQNINKTNKQKKCTRFFNENKFYIFFGAYIPKITTKKCSFYYRIVLNTCANKYLHKINFNNFA